MLIQNQNPEPTEITMWYMTDGGPREQPGFTVPANYRETIRVNDVENHTDIMSAERNRSLLQRFSS